jgi:hypothetical protein
MKTKQLFLLLLLSLLPSLARAAAVWTRVSDAVSPWTSATDMVQYGSYVYVSGSGADDASGTRLWRSTDYATWEPVPIVIDSLSTIDRLLVHDNELYVFARRLTGGVPATVKEVYRSSDGTTWEKILSPAYQVNKAWDDVIVFNGYIYASERGSNGTVIRTNGQDPAPIWETVIFDAAVPPIIGMHFTVFNNQLFACRMPSSNAATAYAYKTADGDNWTPAGSIPNGAAADGVSLYNFTVYKNELYVAYGKIYRYDSNTVTWPEATDIPFEKNFLIFNLFDQLLTKIGPNSASFNGAIFRRASGTWDKTIKNPIDPPSEPSVVSAPASSINYGMTRVPVLSQPGKSYVLFGDIWLAEGGVTSAQKEAFVIDPLEAGLKDKTVFAWSMSTNFGDAIKNLVVENKGSAESTSDILKVSLYRNSTLIVDLVPIPATKKLWMTPSGWDQTGVWDGFNDIYYLKIDINKNVREGKNVLFSIPADGIDWAERPGFVLPGELASMVPMSIKSLGVTGVTLMPFPSTSIDPGDENVLALKFHVTYDSTDTLKSLVVRNNETAEAGQDITKVKLRITNDLAITVIELGALPDNKSWASSPSWPGHFLTSNDQFEILVDISPTARNDKRIQFSLPQNAFQFEVNSDFSLFSDLIEDDILSHPTVAPGPIPEVIIFPNPARDTVRFSYDLSTDADVTISLFDLSGSLVSEVHETKPAGSGAQTAWDASNKAPGTYFAVIKIVSSNGQKRIYKRKVFIKK